jgi:hypothetical protein
MSAVHSGATSARNLAADMATDTGRLRKMRWLPRSCTAARLRLVVSSTVARDGADRGAALHSLLAGGGGDRRFRVTSEASPDRRF